jgi:metal-sulfur cluster biosynthetic enzyme
MTEDDIRDCLNAIQDPCSLAAGAPAGLIDMGMVYEIRVDAEEIHVRLGTTDPRCMMACVFLHEARERLAGLAGSRRVTVALEDRSIWTPNRMTPDYKVRLDRVRATRRGAH